MGKKSPASMTSIFVFMALMTFTCPPVMGVSLPACQGHSFYTASYYTNVETHNRPCADRRYHDLSKELCAATWFYDFGTILKITRRDTGRSIEVVVTDRGPARRLVKKGRILDLSLEAMRRLDGVKSGVIPIQIEKEGN